MNGRTKNERPLATQDRQLDRRHGHDGTQDTWQVNVDVLTVCIRDSALSRGDVVLLQDYRQERSCKVERPKVTDVSDPDDQGDHGADRGQEQALEMLDVVEALRDDPLCVTLRVQRGGRGGIRDDRLLLINFGKALDGQRWRRHAIKFGDTVKHIDSFLLFTLAEQVLWRLLETEDEEPQEEDREGDTTEDDQEVAPAHVASGSAASFTGCNRSAGFEIHVASIFGNSAVGDRAAKHDADRLPHRQESEQESTVLRQELEGDRGVDGDLSAETELKSRRISNLDLCMEALGVLTPQSATMAQTAL